MTARPKVSIELARILIVDDERNNRQLLEVMLAHEGYVLVSVGSGEEALAVVASEPPDLVLLDVMMPGMDGYEVATRIKADPATENIPVIIVTALDDRNARLLGLRAGAEDFLSKPVDRAELCVRVRNLLRLKAYGAYYDRYSHVLEAEVGSRTADLADSERLYRSTFDEAPVGIVHVGLDGAWIRVNQRLCDLLGYSSAELQRNHAGQGVSLDASDGTPAAFGSLVDGTLNSLIIDERTYRRSDGRVVWARVNVSVHRNATGQPQYFIVVIEDITERRALESRIRQAGRMEAVGQLATGIAHDFNNLLTVILGFAELMDEAFVARDESNADVAEIISAAQQAQKLTRQLLAFGRQQVLIAAPVDVNRVVTDMMGMLGRVIGEEIEVASELTPELALALADRGQLEQVLMNLVVNARDAMPDGGRVTISTAEAEPDDSCVRDEPANPGAYVMLAITDTGTGMSAETQRRLFEPFFTTKDVGKGTGLGLSMAYGIVKQSRGYIGVASELGSGTTFRVYLPRADDGAAEPVAHDENGAFVSEAA